MKKYCFKRICTLLSTLFIISLILFGLVKLMPSDPIALMMDPHTKPELYAASYEAKKQELGYDETIPMQYLHYMEHLMTGDFGYSSTYERPVIEVIETPLRNTILLNTIVLIASILITIPLGMYAAIRKDGYIDRFIQYGSLAIVSMPSFLLGVFLLYIICFQFHLLPIGGLHTSSWSDSIVNLILPALTLTLLSVCGLFRYVRNAMIDALSQDYIFGLRSRGIPRYRILFVHVLKNALLPIMSVLVLEIPNLISGSILVEMIFSYNGIGSIMMEALQMRDGYLILTMNMLYAILYVAASFLMDLLSAYLDPRIRLDSYD